MAKKLTDAEIGSLVRRELEIAQGYDSDILATKREAALEYFTGQTGQYIPQAPEGRSNIVSADVRDVHGSVMSQIVHSFKTSSIEFEPLSEEDEEQAQLETDVVKLKIDQNGGDKVFYEAIHDALLSGTGWIKVYVQEDEEVSRESYTAIKDPLAMDALLAEPNGDVEVLSYDENSGDLEVRRTRQNNTLVIESIDPAYMVFSPNHSQYDFQELRFVAERKLYTVSELMDMGVSEEQAMQVPDHADEYWPAAVARENITGTGTGSYSESSDNSIGGDQDATRLKECFHCYMLLDVENNGTAERYHILIGGYTGAELLTIEPFDHIPYVPGSPLPMPHRTEGDGLYNYLKEVQDAKTHTLRQYMDNLMVMNGSRMGVVDGQVNLQDMTNGRLNGLVRIKNPTALVPMPSTDVGMQAITGLEYLDKIRTQRGGASLDLNNSDMQVAQSSAAAAIGEYTAKEKMSTLFARNMVNSLMKGTFLLVHKCLRTYMPGKMGAKIRGKWSETDPGEWQNRTHVQTLVGLNSQERKEKLGGLTQLMGVQMQLLQSGAEGVMVTKASIYNTMADWIRAAELGRPEEYLVDPESEEGQQAQQQISQAGQQQAQQQQQMMQMQLQIEQMKVQMDRYKIDTETKWKYYDTNVDAGLKEAQMTVDNVVEMEKIDASERTAKRGAESASGGNKG